MSRYAVVSMWIGLVASFQWGVLGQIRPPISVPSNPWGFEYPAADDSKVPAKDVVEIFCSVAEPRCRGAWETLKTVQQKYGPSKLKLVFHELAVPSQYNALLLAQGTLVIEHHKKDKLFDFIDHMLLNSEDFSNEATKHLSEAQIVGLLADKAAESTGIDRNLFLSTHNSKRSSASQQWKYATARTASYVPAYFVNGVDVMIGSYEPTVSDWVNFLNPIVG